MPIYNIGGIRVAMSPRYPKLCRKSASYLSEDKDADMNVQLSSEEWAAARARYAYLSEEDLEYILTGKKFYRRAVSYGGIMLHASAIAKGEKAYLFSASSGTGKSTHTALWQNTFSDVTYINDDKPLLVRRNGQFLCCGTPFSGKTDLQQNVMVPCGAICVLKRSEVTRVERLSPSDAVYHILDQTLRGIQHAEELMELCASLVETVPCYRVYTTMEKDAAEIVYNAICHEIERGDDKI